MSHPGSTLCKNHDLMGSPDAASKNVSEISPCERSRFFIGRLLGHASAKRSLAASELRVEHRFKVELVRLLCLILEFKLAEHSPETDRSIVC